LRATWWRVILYVQKKTENSSSRGKGEEKKGVTRFGVRKKLMIFPIKKKTGPNKKHRPLFEGKVDPKA